MLIAVHHVHHRQHVSFKNHIDGGVRSRIIIIIQRVLQTRLFFTVGTIIEPDFDSYFLRFPHPIRRRL